MAYVGKLFISIGAMAFFIGLGQIALAANESPESPQTFTLDGQLFQIGTSNPMLDANAKLTIQILSATKSCVLYEEEQVVNTANSEGYFNVQVGSSVGSSKRTTNDSGSTMMKVFQNLQPIPGKSVPEQNCESSGYTPTAGATRYVRVMVTSSATNIADTLSPDMKLDSVPNALVAQSVQGLERSDILQVNATAPTILTQTNLESLFSTSRLPALQSLADGASPLYITRSSASGAGLPSFTANSPPSSPAPGSIWFDSTANVVKFYNGSTVQALGTAGAGISSLSVGTGLTADGVPGGALTAAGTVDLADIVTASTYTKVTVNAKGRVTAGTSLAESDIPTLSTAGKVSGSAITSGTIAGSTAINTTGNIQVTTANLSATGDGTTTGIVTGQTITSNRDRTRSLELLDNDDSNYVTIKSPSVLSPSYTMTLPGDAGANGQVLSTNGSGVLSWVDRLAGSVTQVTVNAPLTNAGTSTAPNLSVSTATTSAAGVVQLAADGGTTAGTVIQGSDSRLTDSRPPSGSASGDLTGSYPSPTIANSAVTNSKIEDGAISTSKMFSPLANVTRIVSVGGVAGETVSPLTCSNGGEVLKWSIMNGWACGADNNSGGTLTSVALTAPIEISVNGSPLTSTGGTLGISWASANQNTVFAGPSGSNGTPAFRALAAGDIPGLAWSKITSGVPTTLSGYGITDAVRNVAGAPSVEAGLENLKGSGTTAGRLWISTDTKRIYRDTGSAWDLIATPDAGDLTGTLGTSQLPTVPTSKGGTGLTSIGIANQILGMNDAASGLEYKTLTAGSGVTIANTAGGISISAAGSGGTVTNVTGTAPISVSNDTTTPAISIAQANSTTNGFLSSTDWTTFNSKQPAGSYITALTGDVTATGPGSAAATIASAAVTTAKIADGNVTYAKIQNVTSGRILGRSSAGSGVMEELSIGTGLNLTAGTLSNSGVLSVTSANSYLTSSTTSGANTLTLNVGTTANTVASGDDARITGALQRSGGTMTGAINMGGNDLTNVGNLSLGTSKQIQLGAYSTDPSTTGWGSTDKGKAWFNTTTNEIKYWDGSSVKALGTGSGSVTSIATGTGLSGGPITTSGTISLANTTVTAGSYGSASSVATFAVDAQGRLTTAASTPIAIDTTAITSGTLAAARLPGFTGDVSSAAGSSSVSVAKIKGVAISAVAPTDGQFLKYVAGSTNWAPADVRFSDIKNSLGGSAFNIAPCAANQTVAWSSLTDTFTCQDIGSLDGSKITAGTVSASRLPAAASGSAGIVTAAAQTFTGNKTFENNATVTGTLTAASGAKLGNPATCTTAEEGTIKYDSASKSFQGCNGSSWITVGGNGSSSLRDCSTGNANDVMVPVGVWCVDKYEASVWSASDGTGTGFFTDSTTSADTQPYMPTGASNYPASCNRNGAGCTQYAVSKPGVIPSRGMTWYQAARFCANSGKVLIPDDVWQLAAQGTVDPGAGSGTGGSNGGSAADAAAAQCNITTSSSTWTTWLKTTSGVRPTARAGATAGGTNACSSDFGVEDMVGNLWEWTSLNSLQSGIKSTAFTQGESASSGGPFSTADGSWNVNGSAYGCDGPGTSLGACAWKNNVVAAALRGGAWHDGTVAGVTALFLNNSGSNSYWVFGFRCARPR